MNKRKDTPLIHAKEKKLGPRVTPSYIAVSKIFLNKLIFTRRNFAITPQFLFSQETHLKHGFYFH